MSGREGSRDAASGSEGGTRPAPRPERTADRPFPPGDYPLIVVGSGPGGLQVSYALDRLGVPHAVLSADERPGGMFLRWPFFQRLLSWTKPYAPAERGSRHYERYDWNSLLADEPEHRALMPALMDGTSEFPSRAEMEANLTTFAGRTGLRVRFGCRWERTRREEGPEGPRFVLETSDGEYRSPLVVFAIGVAQPWRPRTPGIELAAHYADTRPAETYAGKRVFIIGKQNSGFELASGLLAWARQIVLASPSPAKLSVNTRSLVGIRARYVQPYEDHVLGGGVSILDAAIDSIERSGGGFVVRVRRTDGGPNLILEVDEVIAATGFETPLRDLPELGVATFGQSRLPAQTPFWESATVPGIYFAGTIGQGSAGLKKHGLPSNSGAVHGARYNARVLARTIAERHFGAAPVRPPVAEADLLGLLLDEATRGPEIWHQRAYLARVVTADPERGIVDDGIVPLMHFLDAGGPDAVAMTLEADVHGTLYPVVYLRIRGAVKEHPLD
ncbi:MAG TPA: NAD(P)-binding domain-containing protein, partial [Candidatus Limnocylindrales bacterium]|nr:NAD(P)-binding domain-containing protein [Candidatus Limnocylindrales bacterium]